MIDAFIKIKEERIRTAPTMSKTQRGEEKKDQPFKMKLLSLFHLNMITIFSRVMCVFEAAFHPNYSLVWIWTKILESTRSIKDNTATPLHYFRRNNFEGRSSNSSMNEDKELIGDGSWGQFIELYEEPKQYFCNNAQ